MKLSIIVKSKADFELILPLCEQISKVQKEGKYLFYRFICLCHEDNHNAFKSCLTKYNVNVPYSILEFVDHDFYKNQTLVLEQMRDEIFRNPVESILMIGRDELNSCILELAHEYRIKISLVETKEYKENLKGDYDYIFSSDDPDCWSKIVETITHIYKL